MHRVIQFMELLRDMVNDKDRAAVLYLVKSMLIYLVGVFSSILSRYSKLSRSEDITGRFLSLVDVHCHGQHPLDWYASEMCLTTRYVANTVKQTLGLTASTCIERTLMQRAKVMLSTSATPIQQIAERLGFQNQSHFGTFFKRHEGVSPSKYRFQNHV